MILSSYMHFLIESSHQFIWRRESIILILHLNILRSMELRNVPKVTRQQGVEPRITLKSLTSWAWLSVHTRCFPGGVEMHLDELFTSIINRTASLMHPRIRIYLKRMVSPMKHSVKTPISHNHPLHRAQSQHSRTVNRESGYVPPSRCGPAGRALMSLFLSVISINQRPVCTKFTLHCSAASHTCLQSCHVAGISSLTSLIDLLKRLQENVIFPKLLVVWIIWKVSKWLRWQFIHIHNIIYIYSWISQPHNKRFWLNRSTEGHIIYIFKSFSDNSNDQPDSEPLCLKHLLSPENERFLPYFSSSHRTLQSAGVILQFLSLILRMSVQRLTHVVSIWSILN